MSSLKTFNIQCLSKQLRSLVLSKMGKMQSLSSSNYSSQSVNSLEANPVSTDDDTVNNVSADNVDINILRKIKRLNFNDPTLSQIMLHMKSKKLREKAGLFYFEGKILLKDALEAGVKPEFIFFTRSEDMRDITLPDSSTKLFKVPYNDLKLWSDLTTPPGILVVCKQFDSIPEYQPSIPVNVICDQIRDPGNLGALLRNAAGAGVKKVILTKGCVDLWDPKVMRGGAGAHFRVPICNGLNWTAIPKHVEESKVLIAANRLPDHSTEADDVQSSIVPYYQMQYKTFPAVSLIIGGENEGVSQNAYELSKRNQAQAITIPLSNKVESLNSVAALSIILFEIKRQYLT